MPCCELLLNVVGACPLPTMMFTRPPAMFRPSRRFDAVPAPVTDTPCPIDSVPFDTTIPCPPVLCTVTYDSAADLPAPGETPMAMPELFEPPSMCLLYTSDGADERSSVDLG